LVIFADVFISLSEKSARVEAKQHPNGECLPVFFRDSVTGVSNIKPEWERRKFARRELAVEFLEVTGDFFERNMI